MSISDDLRQAVLQAAIQGKLTKQLPEDGNAKDLLEQIKVEKAKLIKEGKLKKEKPLPEITEDEKPFDIPDNWEWVRLGEVGITNIGLTYKPADIKEQGIIVLRSSNIQDGKLDYGDIVKVDLDIPESKICQHGDILICARNGSKRLVGKAALIDKDGMSFGAFMAIYRSRCNKYILQVINSEGFRALLLGDVGTTTINQITQDMLKNAIVPLPPLSEQKRIVAKVEELMAKIDDLEKTEKELDALKKAFPADMKASLLQAAMQGKLTEQLPEDGSAKDLLEQIKAEKAKLIKEGKLKKEKPLPEIAEEEKPFDIPENWEWCRLGEVSTYGQTKKKINAQEAAKDRWLLDLEDVEKGGTLIQKKTVSESKAKGEKTVFEKGNILYSKLRPYLLKVLEADDNGICTPELVPFDMYGNIANQYVIHFLKSPYVDVAVNQLSYGVKMPRVGTETMLSLLLPLPPHSEQKRIVEKLEKLLLLCDGLK